MTRDPLTLAVLLSTKTGTDSWNRDDLHVTAALVKRVTPNGPNDSGIRNLSESYPLTEPVEAGLSGLQASAMDTVDTVRNYPNRPGLFGWSLDYRGRYAIDADDLDAMSRQLHRITRRMHAVAERLGDPESFAAYVLRMAEAAGARHFIAPTDTPRTGTYTNDADAYRWTDAHGAALWISDVETQYVRRHRPEAAA